MVDRGRDISLDVDGGHFLNSTGPNQTSVCLAWPARLSRGGGLRYFWTDVDGCSAYRL